MLPLHAAFNPRRPGTAADETEGDWTLWQMLVPALGWAIDVSLAVLSLVSVFLDIILAAQYAVQEDYVMFGLTMTPLVIAGIAVTIWFNERTITVAPFASLQTAPVFVRYPLSLLVAPFLPTVAWAAATVRRCGRILDLTDTGDDAAGAWSLDHEGKVRLRLWGLWLRSAIAFTPQRQRRRWKRHSRRHNLHDHDHLQHPHRDADGAHNHPHGAATTPAVALNARPPIPDNHADVSSAGHSLTSAPASTIPSTGANTPLPTARPPPAATADAGGVPPHDLDGADHHPQSHGDLAAGGLDVRPGRPPQPQDQYARVKSEVPPLPEEPLFSPVWTFREPPLHVSRAMRDELSGVRFDAAIIGPLEVSIPSHLIVHFLFIIDAFLRAAPQACIQLIGYTRSAQPPWPIDAHDGAASPIPTAANTAVPIAIAGSGAGFKAADGSDFDSHNVQLACALVAGVVVLSRACLLTRAYDLRAIICKVALLVHDMCCTAFTIVAIWRAVPAFTSSLTDSPQRAQGQSQTPLPDIGGLPTVELFGWSDLVVPVLAAAWISRFVVLAVVALVSGFTAAIGRALLSASTSPNSFCLTFGVVFAKGLAIGVAAMAPMIACLETAKLSWIAVTDFSYRPRAKMYPGLSVLVAFLRGGAIFPDGVLSTPHWDSAGARDSTSVATRCRHVLRTAVRQCMDGKSSVWRGTQCVDRTSDVDIQRLANIAYLADRDVSIRALHAAAEGRKRKWWTPRNDQGFAAYASALRRSRVLTSSEQQQRAEELQQNKADALKHATAASKYPDGHVRTALSFSEPQGVQNAPPLGITGAATMGGGMDQVQSSGALPPDALEHTVIPMEHTVGPDALGYAGESMSVHSPIGNSATDHDHHHANGVVVRAVDAIDDNTASWGALQNEPVTPPPGHPFLPQGGSSDDLSVNSHGAGHEDDGSQRRSAGTAEPSTPTARRDAPRPPLSAEIVTDESNNKAAQEKPPSAVSDGPHAPPVAHRSSLRPGALAPVISDAPVSVASTAPIATLESLNEDPAQETDAADVMMIAFYIIAGVFYGSSQLYGLLFPTLCAIFYGWSALTTFQHCALIGQVAALLIALLLAPSMYKYCLARVMASLLRGVWDGSEERMLRIIKEFTDPHHTAILAAVVPRPVVPPLVLASVVAPFLTNVEIGAETLSAAEAQRYRQFARDHRSLLDAALTAKAKATDSNADAAADGGSASGWSAKRLLPRSALFESPKEADAVAPAPDDESSSTATPQPNHRYPHASWTDDDEASIGLRTAYRELIRGPAARDKEKDSYDLAQPLSDLSRNMRGKKAMSPVPSQASPHDTCPPPMCVAAGEPLVACIGLSPPHTPSCAPLAEASPLEVFGDLSPTAKAAGSVTVPPSAVIDAAAPVAGEDRSTHTNVNPLPLPLPVGSPLDEAQPQQQQANSGATGLAASTHVESPPHAGASSSTTSLGMSGSQRMKRLSLVRSHVTAALDDDDDDDDDDRQRQLHELNQPPARSGENIYASGGDLVGAGHSARDHTAVPMYGSAPLVSTLTATAVTRAASPPPETQSFDSSRTASFAFDGRNGNGYEGAMGSGLGHAEWLARDRRQRGMMVAGGESFSHFSRCSTMSNFDPQLLWEGHATSGPPEVFRSWASVPCPPQERVSRKALDAFALAVDAERPRTLPPVLLALLHSSADGFRAVPFAPRGSSSAAARAGASDFAAVGAERPWGLGISTPAPSAKIFGQLPAVAAFYASQSVSRSYVADLERRMHTRPSGATSRSVSPSRSCTPVPNPNMSVSGGSSFASMPTPHHGSMSQSYAAAGHASYGANISSGVSPSLSFAGERGNVLNLGRVPVSSGRASPAPNPSASIASMASCGTSAAALPVSVTPFKLMMHLRSLEEAAMMDAFTANDKGGNGRQDEVRMMRAWASARRSEASTHLDEAGAPSGAAPSGGAGPTASWTRDGLRRMIDREGSGGQSSLRQFEAAAARHPATEITGLAELDLPSKCTADEQDGVLLLRLKLL